MKSIVAKKKAGATLFWMFGSQTGEGGDRVLIVVAPAAPKYRY